MSAITLAAEIRAGRQSAVAVARAALDRIGRENPVLVAVTQLLEPRALAEAAQVDAMVAAGRDPGPLAGVPYVVKDLFDVAGLPTTAGAGMRRHAPPATHDAEAVARFRAAGAVLLGTTNMDEFAYGFATINASFGTTRNPHDLSRIAGGSSGGSAALVAAGIVPLSLGSDTNGSIRVPAGLTGLFGLKPSHGALPMAGVYPFVHSFDDIGPFATTAADLRLAWQVLGGEGRGVAQPRVARLGGWFARNADAALIAGIDALDDYFGGVATVELPEVARARSAAFLMSAAEGGALHLPELRTRALDYDPQVRDRLIAGALLPASAYLAAQRFRAWFHAQAMALFEQYDVLIAPSAGTVAPLADDPMIDIDGARVPARAHLGIFTQPLNLIGLPVVAAPLKRPGQLPLGLQLIGKPGSDATLFDLAERLETAGLVGASPS